MPYAVRAKGNDDGSYTYTYGKGQRKLEARAYRDGRNWHIDGLGIDAKLRDLKARWGKWAEANYEGTSTPTGTPSQEAGCDPLGSAEVTSPPAFPALSPSPLTRTDRCFLHELAVHQGELTPLQVSGIVELIGRVAGQYSQAQKPRALPPPIIGGTNGNSVARSSESPAGIPAEAPTEDSDPSEDVEESSIPDAAGLDPDGQTVESTDHADVAS